MNKLAILSIILVSFILTGSIVFVVESNDELDINSGKLKNRIHPNNLNLILEPTGVCSNEEHVDPKILVYVFSRVGSTSLRSTIRNAWSSRFDRVRAVFVIGQSENSILADEIQKESLTYGDLIQGDFVDTYRNLPFKSLSAWMWATKNCKFTRYFLKLDDDVVPNIPYIMRYLKSGKFRPPRRWFACNVMSSVKPIRDKSSSYGKYFTTFDEWRENKYPKYCDGVAVLFNYDLMTRLYSQSHLMRDFWIDDVYVGLLASQIKHVRFINWSRFVYRYNTSSPRLKKTFLFVKDVQQAHIYSQLAGYFLEND